MSCPTDTNPSLSLSTSALANLYPEALSRDEALNGLGSLTLHGYNVNALTLSFAVASHATATLHNDANQRPLDALVAEIRQLPADATADRYQLVLRPWLWWLTLASNNRVFQNRSTSDIVTAIFIYLVSLIKNCRPGSYTPFLSEELSQRQALNIFN